MNGVRKYRVRVPDDEHWRREIKCQSACPVHTDARGYIRAIGEGDLEGAYLIARGPNPLASICGRICGAPCEMNCRRGSLDAPVSIRALKRYACERWSDEGVERELNTIQKLKDSIADAVCAGEDEFGVLHSLFDGGSYQRASGQRIAIIGSGPAGLAAAHDLRLFGFKPIIFEMERVPAGMLYLGVPEYRLPRKLIEAEVDLIVSMGVEIRTGVAIGRDIALKELLDEYEAVVIAVGAKKSRQLPIKGAQGKGVFSGVDFLRSVALSEKMALGEEFVVIGGGNVAYDVSRTAIRHKSADNTAAMQLDREVADDISRVALRQAGVKRVHLCCLESREEMLADEVEIREGAEEGVLLHNALGPEEILLDDSGAVRAVRFKKVVSVYDEEGRFAPTFDEQVKTELSADTVLVAIGQECDFSFIDSNRDGVKLTDLGTVVLNEEQMTTRQGLYVAGDAVSGPKLMIDAIASGKRVARAVYKYVTGRAISFELRTAHTALPGYARRPRYESIPRQSLPAARPELRRSSVSIEVEHCYESEAALAEAERCLDCGVNTIFDATKCILCGGCVDVCPELCLKLVSLEYLAGDSQFEHLRVQWEADEDGPISTIIKNDERCTRCALCAERCPVDAITMERFAFSCMSSGGKSVASR